MPTDQLLLLDLPIDPERDTSLDVENCLQEMLLELMKERNCEFEDIEKETGIPRATLYDWYSGSVGTQKVSKSLWKLASFFNVHLEYLCFGIGNGDPAYEDIKKRPGRSIEKNDSCFNSF